MAGDIGGLRISRPGLLAFGNHYFSETNCSQFTNSDCIVQVSCTGIKFPTGKINRHATVVCASGHVYTFGYADHHDWMKKEASSEPTLVTALSSVKIVRVACGCDSTFFLTDAGQLYSCGWNDYGQLGLGNNTKRSRPVLVNGLPRITNVAAKVFHTVVLTDNGGVYVCGNNDKGQLGLGHTKSINRFTVVSGLPEKVSDIACGAWHTALLTVSKRLYMAGTNDENQLGASGGDSLTFQPVSLRCDVISMACGVHHTVALTSNHKAWTWGDNQCCQLGNGKRGGSDLVSQVLGLEGHTIIGVSAGNAHTAFLTDQGDVLVCGRGESGELVHKAANIMIPILIPKSPTLRVRQIAFGFDYSLLHVTTDNRTVTLSQDVDIFASYDQLKICVADLKRIILKCLECPVCFKPMQTPIHLCVNGHSICGPCHSQLNSQDCPICRQAFSSVKNIALQNLAADIQLPCAECLQCMSIADQEDHTSVCPNRQYSCPLGQACDFRGRPDAISTHALLNHPQQTLQELPHTFTHSLTDRHVSTELMVAKNDVFVLMRTSTNDDLRFTVSHLGTPDDAKQYKFELEINGDSDDYSVIIRKRVCSYLGNHEELKSPNCASVKRDQLINYLVNVSVTCKVHIIYANN